MGGRGDWTTVGSLLDAASVGHCAPENGLLGH
jgi:hypothetical protein